MMNIQASTGRRFATIRALPFFFSENFFLLFVVASLVVVPAYPYLSGGIGILFVIDTLMLSLALVDFLLPPHGRAIDVSRPISFPLIVDKSNEITLEVANSTGCDVSLIVQDDVPATCVPDGLPLRAMVKPGSGNRLTYRLVPLERGNGEFGNVTLWTRGRLGLVWKRRECHTSRVVKLYPGLALIEKHALRIRHISREDQIRPLRKRGTGGELDSLREYVAGDDTRQIHWRTSARRGKLVVRTDRMERSQNIFLVLDTGRMMTARALGKTKLDHSLNAALLLAYSALQVGDKVGIMAIGQEIEAFLPPSSSPGQFARILESTYALLPKLDEPRYYRALSGVSGKLKRRSLVVLFTDLIDERSSTGLLRYSLGLLPRHLPLVVALSDSELIAMAERPPESEQDLYRQGVAAEMLRRREVLVAKLSSLGAIVLDVPPENLSAAVLDRYLEIKASRVL